MTQEKQTKPAALAKVASDISAVDLRVGVITNARRHENAESLYVEDVEVGEPQTRQVTDLPQF